jgi:hypothetical protein
MTSLASYPRQRLRKRSPDNGKTTTVIPVNDFLKDIRHGIGVVSRNAEEEIIACATELSYRKTETIVEKKLGREAIRQGVLRRGDQAKVLSPARPHERVITERALKDAEDRAKSCRKSAGGAVRRALGALFNWRRLYVLIDGVQVFQKDGECESRECKVGAILRQQSEKIIEMAAWCSWGRIKVFRTVTHAAFLAAAAALNFPVVIVSDGAKWIRNMRKWIPGLARAVWILDWFHCKDHLLKCLKVFAIEEASEIAQTLIGWLWRGNVEETKKLIAALPRSVAPEARETETAALQNFLVYLDNQREGIIDYDAYQQQGYIVGSGFVEKLNDLALKNRMVRGKRMRWSLAGGEAMMALLAARHNGRLAEVFA